MTGVPLTVIGGFLGAGKTTVVNHLLRNATRRWGVLVNDFGAINIDAALIAAHDGDTIALTNGCVCCGMSDDLGAGLARLATRASPVEHVIVEASGVSDPRRIAQYALVEPGYSLEPIVVVADARALSEQLHDRWVADTVRAQLAAAEIVLLNKIDLADPATLAAACCAIATIRPGVRVAELCHGAVSEDLLRFPGARATRFHADAPPWHEFVTWHWLPPAALDRERLRTMLRALPASVLRVKGFCRLAPDAAPHLLQFASGQWTLSPADALEPSMVVIGTPDLPHPDALTALFGKTLASSQPDES
ncbi:MAG TPA: CobW family GTP-binding protein [Acetobacteraceae bacterium]|jgi:G3E family GTPase